MGGCFSAPEVQNKEELGRSTAIDKYLSDERKKSVSQRMIKLLLLGSGESGKSTIAKQMKIIHMNGYSHNELVDFKQTVFKNLYECIWSIVEASERFAYVYTDPACKEFAESVLSKRSPTLFTQFTVETAHMIRTLWQDPTTKRILARSNEFQLLDSAQYLFENLDRITSAHYVPTEDDVLRTRVKSTGITETRFTMDKLNITMYDVGGQRSERKKWIHCFEDVTSVIFVVALSEYDQVLLEDSSQNRMAESLVLFESIANSKWFVNSSIILFLNKIDLFKEKLKTVPLEKYFPEYAGGEDFTSASKFILWRFKQLNKANLALYPHLTCATDTRQIRVVFNALKDTLIKNSLKSSGIM